MSANNPFAEGSTEAMNYDAGLSAMDAGECPYEKDSEDDKPLYSAWIRGFKAKGKKKSTATKPTGDLESFRTADLEAELMKRKRTELDKLLKQQADIEKRVSRLKALFGE
jgi:hypothetical protein